MELEYEKDVSIDPDALDVEWLEQPRLMVRYSQYLAEKRQEVDQAKTRMDIVKAELDQRIRTDPEKFDISKVTEGAINAAITTHPEYNEAMEELTTAQYEMNMAQGAVRAIDGKKDALENLVRLYGQQYFAGPKVPRDINHEWQQRQEQVSSNKKIKIRRKK